MDDFGRAVSRILSAPCGGENHLSEQPYPKLVCFRKRGAGRSSVSYLALHPMGFSVPPCLRSARWSLTPPFHPCLTSARRFHFLWHCPSKRFCVLPACILSSKRPVTRHRALRCSDFPPPAHAESDSPLFQNQGESISRRELCKNEDALTLSVTLPISGNAYTFLDAVRFRTASWFFTVS